jgi:hypothetical protein
MSNPVTFHLRARVHNMLTTALDCAGIEPEQTVAPSIAKNSEGYNVDLVVDDCDAEQLAYMTGFMAEQIGMKNVWFDTYPKSGVATFEFFIPEELLAR